MNDGSEPVPSLAQFKKRIAALDARYQRVVDTAQTVPLQNTAATELDTLKQAYWHIAAELHQAGNDLRRQEEEAAAMPAAASAGFWHRLWDRLLVRWSGPPVQEDPAPPDPATDRIQRYEALKSEVHRKAMDVGDLSKAWRGQYQAMLEDEAWWAWDINVKVTLQDYGMCPVCTEAIVEAAQTCAGCGARLRYATSTVSSG